MQTYTNLSVAAQIADLAFSLDVPDHWHRPALPEQSPDFSQPDAFAMLLMMVAPMSPVVLAVMARPGFGDGTLRDWAMYLLNAQQMKPVSIERRSVGPMESLAGVAHQAESDIGPRSISFAFIEDGGRLVGLFLNGPHEMTELIEPVFDRVLERFRLERPMGQTVDIGWENVVKQSPVEAPVGQTVDIGRKNVEEQTPAQVEARAEETADVGSENVETQPSVEVEGPAFWREALKLEARNELEKAEQLVRDSIPPQAFAIQIAEMYRLRKWRLTDAGDAAGATHAHEQAVRWANSYAAGATSGGEGEAMSVERDEFIAQLESQP